MGAGGGSIAWFDRDGLLAMANAGPNTNGSQFFITLSPQPHLDGTFTAFGEVVSGWSVLERIVAGDRIVSVNGKPVASWGDLRGRIGSARPGDAWKLEVVREDARLTMELVLGER